MTLYLLYQTMLAQAVSANQELVHIVPKRVHIEPKRVHIEPKTG